MYMVGKKKKKGEFLFPHSDTTCSEPGGVWGTREEEQDLGKGSRQRPFLNPRRKGGKLNRRETTLRVGPREEKRKTGRK